MAKKLYSCYKHILGLFAGLKKPASRLVSPHAALFIHSAKQCFSLTQPASFSQDSVSRTGPFFLSYVPNKHFYSYPLFSNPLFSTCNPIISMCFSYSYVSQILRSKGALRPT